MVNSYSAAKKPAVFAGQHCAECMSYAMSCCPTSSMPFMPAMSMGMAAAATATAFTLLGTGVSTSVSLFVVGIILGLFLLVGLVVLISLLLTCLTGLVRLGSLVGLIEELATNVTRGD